MTPPLYTTNRSSYRADIWWPHPFKTYPGPWKPPVEAVSPVEDSNPVEKMNDTGSYGFFASTIVGVAQGFTAHKGGKLTSAVVYPRRNAGNVDHLPLTAAIYDTTRPIGTAKPEGVALAVSDPFDSELLTTENTRVELLFTGANQLQFVKDKVYCLALERPAESADIIRFGFYMGIAEQHAGVFTEHRTTGWLDAADPAFDLIFYVYST